jgi:SAM-dependent methyltransferase
MLDDLVPPIEILLETRDGTPMEQYKEYGEGFVRPYLISRARLQPFERVLEVGSGNGQKARVLTSYLDEKGSYEGIDIIPAGVRWCEHQYVSFPNFHFQLADLYNDMYNPQGVQKDADYSFPFNDDEFDLVYLCSVFTHMMLDGIARYISEIRRVLKPGGRCLLSFFLLNDDSVYWMETGQPLLDFPYKFDGYRLRNLEMKADAVAVEEEWVRDQFLRARLRLTEVTYGNWSGGKDLLYGLQDTMICVKM